MNARINVVVAMLLVSLAVPGGQRSVHALDMIRVEGNVLDAETGLPVESFIIQSGRFDDGPAGITWHAMSQGIVFGEGQFQTTIQVGDGWVARVVAPGYRPQIIMADSAARRQETTIRLARGHVIKGQVLDHVGDPVPGALVYEAGSLPTEHSVSARWENDEQRASRDFWNPAQSDENGKFELEIGYASGVMVKAPGLNCWSVELPGRSAQDDTIQIRLPKPAQLSLEMDVKSLPDDVLFVHLLDSDLTGCATVDATGEVHLEMGERVELSDLTPGTYQVSRVRTHDFKGFAIGVHLDSQVIELADGQSQEITFMREKGLVATGTVRLPEEAKLSGIVISVSRIVATDEMEPDSRLLDSQLIRPRDIDVENGLVTFTSEKLSPGSYEIEVEVYLPLDEELRFSTAWISPAFSASQLFEVPESEEEFDSRLPLVFELTKSER